MPAIEFETLTAWTRTRMTAVPRIDNLRQLELLCEADTDRDFWRCIVEGAALDVRGSLANFLCDPWRNALQSLRWTREEYISNYAISKANEEATALDREEALEAADQRLTDEINFYLSRLFGGKPVLADAIEPPRSHVPLPNAQSLPFESGDETMPATKQPKRTNPATNKETDDELLAWSLGACFNNPPVSKDLRKLQEQGATDEDLLEAILVEWSTPNAGSARPYHTEATHTWWGAAIWYDTDHAHGAPKLFYRLDEGKPEGSLLTAVRRVLGITEPLEKDKPGGESDVDLLKRSLSPGDFTSLKKNGATDDELLVAINQAWRMPLVKGPRKYTVSTTSPKAGTAIWFDTLKQDGTPNYSTFSELSKAELLRKVRDLFNINFIESQQHETNGHPGDTDAQKFETLKAKGKSQAKGTAIQVSEHPTKPNVTIVKSVPDSTAAEPPIEISSEIVRKPLSWFKKSPFDTRAARPKPWVEELATDLLTNGQLQTCLARPDGQHIAGWTRVEAALVAPEVAKRLRAGMSPAAVDELNRRLERLQELDVRIVTCTDAQARRLVLVENAKRRDLTEREKTEAYSNLAADYAARGVPQKQLAHDLGIKESTLSNNLRLKSLPRCIWDRHEKGCLSIDQIRKLAPLAEHKAFSDAFIHHLDCGHIEPGRMTGTDDFDNAFDDALNDAFRPMKVTQYGNGCKFTPTADQRSELKILQVDDSFGNKSEVAANVELWDKLNKAALKEARAKEKAARKPSATSAKAAERVKAERRDQERRRELLECWYRARSTAIAQMFVKPRKQDYATATQLVAVVLDDDQWNLDLDRKELLKPHAEFISHICERLREYFADPKGAGLSPDIMEEIVDWLHLDPVPFWQPSEGLLKSCTAEELAEIAEQFELPANQKANDLVEVLVKDWPPGLVPDLFLLEQPKAKKPTKKAKAK